ncbi:hypothetical protein NDU88_000265 [Pleurodeles waltl]|uniref:Uncharacterized protein n=1 Tax=Pleurodeles waltl TaxID=8319 RepID=A0AAV7V720_PLEWA|nr:hypothetical protein NDU88_000265 [Pleurodeles waltl]
MQGRGFAARRRPRPPSGPQEVGSGRSNPKPRGSQDASAPHEHPTDLRGGHTGPKLLPARSGARRQVERLS